MPPMMKRGAANRPQQSRFGSRIHKMQEEDAENKRRKEQREREERNLAANLARQRANAKTKQGPKCPNPSCSSPKIVDGTCQSCGAVVDDSNIVAEVQFGETSSGAAMVQGSFISADQAGARSMGPGFRRAGGSDQREKSLADAREIIASTVQQLNGGTSTDQNIVDMAVRSFRLAASDGFTQGRSLPLVCAVCIYLSYRQQTDDPSEKPKVMLLDLADVIKINVFKLGRTFKALCKKIPTQDINTIFPEDIIYRLAVKLDFGHNTAKVAEDAVRLIKSMRKDWIIVGRRPSGICGACLLIAARMNNFRRTVREVVYVVKVTSHTIEERMKEFNQTAASRMTVDDFLSPAFLDSGVSHDPPAFYRQTKEYKKKLREERRKRKRTRDDDGSDERDGEEDHEEEDESTPEPDPASLGPDLSGFRDLAELYERDADGYLIPPVPPKNADGEVSAANAPEGEETINALMQQFADEGETPAGNDNKKESSGRKPKGPRLPIDEEWEGDEANIEEQISEIMNDPETLEHAEAYGNAEQRARLHASWARQNEPSKVVSEDKIVGEDEFANDPEVMNAVLSPEEVKLKELLWVNENKDWLRANQERMFQRKLEGDKPKRPRKNKKPRLGEGQTSPASTPIEAAQNGMQRHGMSKRINYDAITDLFNEQREGTSSGQTSKANSVLGSAFRENEAADMSDSSDDEDEELGGGEGGDDEGDYDDYDEDYDNYGDGDDFGEE